jgi:hypothetical protein
VPNLDGQWEWNSLSANDLEYEWHVKLVLPKQTVEVGYTLFNAAGNLSGTGTFAQLLARGQTNVWTIDSSGKATAGPNGQGLTVKQTGTSVEIDLTDSALIAELRAARPAEVQFESVVHGGAENIYPVTLQYLP